MFGWVKEKAANAGQVLGKDLAEFARVVQTDTTELIHEKKAKEAERQPAKAFKIPPRILTDFHSNIDTYRVPLDESDTVYKEWKEETGFSVEGATNQISEVLSSNVSVKTYHAELVPSEVSYHKFWERYFYRLHCLQREEERKALLETINTAAERSEEEDDDDLSWGDALDVGNNDPVMERKPAQDSTAELQRRLEKALAENRELRRMVSKEVRAAEGGAGRRGARRGAPLDVDEIADSAGNRSEAWGNARQKRSASYPASSTLRNP
eukprot:Sspe_Gene.6417::Locus_2167_Transcript_1_1_Confidence_1.000_Length_998::g.6417::m.6417